MAAFSSFNSCNLPRSNSKNCFLICSSFIPLSRRNVGVSGSLLSEERNGVGDLDLDEVAEPGREAAELGRVLLESG